MGRRQAKGRANAFDRSEKKMKKKQTHVAPGAAAAPTVHGFGSAAGRRTSRESFAVELP